MKKYTRILELLLSLMFTAIGIAMCIKFYDWKLIIIIFLFMFANNISILK